MPKKQSPEKQIQRLIAEAFRSYILAAKNRRRALEHCDMAFDVKKWQAKAPPLTRLAAVLARVCDTISHELQILYAIEERLRQNTDKSLHIVIEHVESPWRTEADQSADRGNNNPLQEVPPHQPRPANPEQSEA